MRTWSAALSAAVQLERDGREFYLKVATQASNPLAGRMFESLADDELRHIEWLEDLSPGVEDARAANESLYRRLMGIFADAPTEMRDGAALAADDVEAIDVAIGVEDKSVAAYAEWGEKGPTAAIRKLGGAKDLVDPDKPGTLPQAAPGEREGVPAAPRRLVHAGGALELRGRLIVRARPGDRSCTTERAFS